MADLVDFSIVVSSKAEITTMGLQNLENEIPLVGRKQIYNTAQRIVGRMKKPIGPVKRPIRWVSKRQQSAFFASNGFGGSIPHSSGETAAGFRITKISDGYQITNEKEGAEFVFGNLAGQGQSQIHSGRWPLIRTVSEEEIAKLPQDVQSELETIINKTKL